LFSLLRKEVQQSHLKASAVSRSGDTGGDQSCKEILLAYQNRPGQVHVVLVGWGPLPVHLLQLVALAEKER